MNITSKLGRAFVSPGKSENTVLLQSCPGILVFSRSRQLQYVNRRALKLIGNIGQAMTESCLIALPSQLLELRDQIQESLEDRLRANIWEPFEVSRMVAERGQRLLLRGFGQPDRAVSLNSRIIILLEEIKFVEEDRSQLADSRMRLSELQKTGVGFPATA